MNIIDAIILGMVQGLTEFLPISSSGHLVIGESLLGLKMPGVSLEVWLHLGTLIAVLIYFRQRLAAILMAMVQRKSSEGSNQNRTLFWALVIGTLPAAIIGLGFKSKIEAAFASAHFSAAMLLVTGLILLLTVLAKSKSYSINIMRGLVVGVAQAVAILPGISRSGSTISCGLFLGVEPALAAEFSFLLSIPAVAGAFLLDMISAKGQFVPQGEMLHYLAGAAMAFIFGILSIHFLLKLLKSRRFFIFGFYCLVVGTLALIYLP